MTNQGRDENQMNYIIKDLDYTKDEANKDILKKKRKKYSLEKIQKNLIRVK